MRAGRYEDELEFWVEVSVRMPLKGDKVDARVSASLDNPWKLTREAMPRVQSFKINFLRQKTYLQKDHSYSTSLTYL